MANRRLFQFRYSYDRDMVEIWGSATIGSSGAVSSYSGTGISSIVKESTAGQYTINLVDSFNSLKMVSSLVKNSSGIPASPIMGLVSEQVSSLTAPKLVVQFSDVETPAATNPASGDVIYFHITLKNSST